MIVDLGRETDGNNEICLGVRSCLVQNPLNKNFNLCLCQ